ncbi:ATP-binding protein [Nonomuraea sp. CA-143628]|uniref:ATP-binding protein n=1 Tax=Nonomuraea sp. CA-143628 TaxID=3239997 RepID=UPI003D92C261
MGRETGKTALRRSLFAGEGGMDLLPRLAADSLKELLAELRIVIINGPRQSGKTTLLQSCRRFGEATVTTLDDPSELAIAKDDPRTFVRRRPQPVIIDEIQRAGDPLILAIKQVVDEDWSPGQFVLSGSTRFLSIPTLSESLAGRVAFVNLWPFAVSERVGDTGGFCDQAFIDPAGFTGRQSAWTREDYIHLISQGSYPEVLRLNSPVAIRAWFRGYLDTVISRDIREFAHVNKAQAIPDLIALVAARAGGQLVLAHIADGLGLDVATVRTYLAYLETVFLVAPAPAWSNELSSRVTHAPKTYVTDSGLAAHCMDVDAESLLAPGHPALDGLLETFVFAELLKLSTFARRHVTVRHYRDREKREIDFILERRDGTVVGIEVKASATPKSEDAKHLRWLRDKLGDRFRAGYVLHLGTTNLPSGDRIVFSPLSILWNHMGPDTVTPSLPSRR